MRHGILGAASIAGLAALVAACGGHEKRPVGSTCEGGEECVGGLCYEGICLDPSADDDLDGLTNGLEVSLGTDPSAADTDDDGASDRDELDPSLALLDSDDDGLPDAVESRATDRDQDCLVDELDARNDDPDPRSRENAARIATACGEPRGVCAAEGAALGVRCLALDQPTCDYAGVPGHADHDTTCDERDDDCDGTTDEDCIPSDPLKVGLIGAWPLDGDGADVGPYHDDGVVTGATAAADRFGAAGKALRFAAAQDRVLVAATHHPTGEVTATYSAWVKPEVDDGATGAVLSFGDATAANARSSLALRGARSCVSYVGNGNDAGAARACAPDGRWSHVVVVKQGLDVRLYLNGRRMAEATLAAGQDLRQTGLAIGLAGLGDGGALEPFRGVIDDVHAWSRALPDTEIATLYREGGWAEVGTAENPASSCTHVRDGGAPDGSGLYWLAGPGASDKFQAYCDMTTDGGGWTLAWSYGFTAPDAFSSAGNAVTPIPTWPAPRADVPTSTSVPTATTRGAIDFPRWAALGGEVMLRSDLLDTIACVPQGGSLVDAVSGPVSCRVLEEHTSRCDGTLPGFVGWNADGPSFGARSLYLYFDGATSIDWPTHDPCGLNAPPAAPVAAGAGGSVWLREADYVPPLPYDCSQIVPDLRPEPVYRIDPDGPGGRPSFLATCDFGAARGGWTLLSPEVLEALGAQGERPREYLYTRGDAWYRSPVTSAPWSFTTYAAAPGLWVHDGAGGPASFACGGAGPSGDHGIGCADLGGGPRVLPRAPHDDHTTRLCQSPPDAFGVGGDGCADATSIWVRPARCTPDAGSLLGDGQFSQWAAQDGDFFSCWFGIGPGGPRDGFEVDLEDAPPGGAGPSLAVTNPMPGDDPWAVELSQEQLTFLAGHAYRLGFWARAAEPRLVPVMFQRREAPTPYHYEDVAVGTEWSWHEVAMVADETSFEGRVVFQAGGLSGATLWFDDIVLVDDGPAPCAPIGAELLGDPGFAHGTACWPFAWDRETTTASAVSVDAEGASDGRALRVTQAEGSEPWRLSLRQERLATEASRHYRLTVRARADAARTLVVGVHGEEGDGLLQYWQMPVATDWSLSEFDFVTSDPAPAGVTVELQLGDADASAIELDSVSLVDVEADPCHRDGASLVVDGDFSSGLACWQLGWNQDLLLASAGRDLTTAPAPGGAPSLRVAQAPPAANPWEVGLYQGGLALEAGGWYRLEVSARAAAARPISVGVWEGDTTILYGQARVGTSWGTYTFDFVAPTTTDPAQTALALQLGDPSGAVVWLDDVRVVRVGDDPCVRSGSLIADGELDAGLMCWFPPSPGGSYAPSTDHPAETRGPSLAVTNTTAGGNLWDTQLIQRGFHIEAGADYSLDFWARAAAPRTITVLVHNWDTGIQQLYEVVSLGTEWQHVHFDFTGETTEDDVLLELQFGAVSTATVWVDGFALGPRGLVSRWAFDDADGAVAADATGANPGAVTGGATWLAASECKRGGCLHFDGTAAVQAGTSGVPSGAAPRTLALWFRSDKDLQSSTEAALAQWGTTTNGNMFGLITSINDRDRLYFYGWNSDLAAGPQLATGQWYHGAVTYDGGTVRLYLDGVEIGAKAMALSTIIDPTYGVTIGWRPSTIWWTGALDDVRIYDRALTAGEVMGLVTGATP